MHLEQCNNVVVCIIALSVYTFNLADRVARRVAAVTCEFDWEIPTGINVTVILILRHSDQLSVPRRGLEIFALRRNNKVFCLHELRALPIKIYVPPDFLKSLANQWQVKQHLVQIREILGHLLCNLVVHEFTNTTGLVFGLFVRLTDDRSFYRATGRIKFGDRPCIELRCSFSDERVNDNAQSTTCTKILALLQSTFSVKGLQAIFIFLFPFRASRTIGLVI